MTKISQLSSIGDSLAVGDQFLIRDIDDAGSPNKSVTVSGITRALDLGTAAAPAIAFATDKNSGIFSPGADQVAISTNGTGRLFVNASGNVGVGVGSPNAPLNVVADNVAFRGQLSLQTLNANSYGQITFYDRATLGAQIVQSYTSGIYDLSILNVLNGSLTFGTNNTERMRLTSAGLLGLGTSSPSFAAHISSAKNTSQLFIGITGLSSVDDYAQIGLGSGSTPYGLVRLGFDNPAGVTNTYLSFYNNNGSSNVERLRIDSSGRVGIGTTAPSFTLDIAAESPRIRQVAVTGTNSSFIQLSNTSGSAYFGLDSSAGGLGAAYGLTMWHAGNYPLVFGTNNTERARIDSSGRLLVGTSTAVTGANASISKLNVIGNSLNSAGNSVAVIGRGAAASTLSAGNDVGAIFFTDNGSNEFAAIACQVDAATGAADAPGRLVFSTTADGAASPTERMRITSVGHVLVGQTTGDFNTVGNSLFANGTAQFVSSGQTTVNINRKASDGTAVQFYRDANTPGSISVTTTATTYATSSDYRLKENVVPLTGAIDRVNDLQVHRFNFIADPDKTVDGFLAHEAQAVVPEAVIGEKDAVDDDGNPVYQGIDQSKLVPLLTAALQEAIAEIASLKDRVAALEGE